MELYNCESEREKELKEIELVALNDLDLEFLANEIFEEFKEDELEDETIVVDAMHQITHEALRRLAAEKAFSLGMIKNG